MIPAPKRPYGAAGLSAASSLLAPAMLFRQMAERPAGVRAATADPQSLPVRSNPARGFPAI